jgi:hypothetical protein
MKSYPNLNDIYSLARAADAVVSRLAISSSQVDIALLYFTDSFVTIYPLSYMSRTAVINVYLAGQHSHIFSPLETRRGRYLQ